MAAQYHSEICARAHSAMQELFGAGLLDPQGMQEFDILCRSDVNGPPRQEPQPLSSPQQMTAKPAPTWTKAPPPGLAQPSASKPALRRAAQSAAPANPKPSSGAGPQIQDSPVFYATRAHAVAMARPKGDATSILESANPGLPPPTLVPGPMSKSVAGAVRPALPRVEDWKFSAVSRAPATAPWQEQNLRQLGPTELRALREREGVSETVFARCLEVLPQTVIAWESGRARPDSNALRLLAAIDDRGLSAVA